MTNIEVTTVVGVLLQDAWHQVAAGSFTVAPAEYTRDGHPIVAGGRSAPPPHYAFIEQDQPGVITGPISAILGIRLQ